MDEARSYRGKVLSLESSESYRGTLGRVRVHRLAPVSREQLVLPQKTLELLERNVHEFIQQRQQLRKLNMQLKKGLLFYGPPGTGKTHTIRYLASQLPEHTTFLITAEQVSKLPQYLSFARLLQPALVVIEDVDLLARQRGQAGGAYEEILLNQLLNEMDGLREEAEILFILTTNRPEHLEAALSSRPGRIDQAVEFPLPDERGRAQLLKLYSGGLKVGSAVAKEAVRRLQGVSPAFIKEMMRRAAQNMLRDSDSELRLTHLRQALEEMVFQGGSLNLQLLGGAQLAQIDS
ncbi:MAG: ATP-binding protein [Vulcanimicrobiota bacterium]